MQVVDHIFSFLRHKRAVYSPKGTWFTPTLRTFQVDLSRYKSWEKCFMTFKVWQNNCWRLLGTKFRTSWITESNSDEVSLDQGRWRELKKKDKYKIRAQV